MKPKELVDRAVVSLGKDGILPVYRFNKLSFESTQRPGGPWIYIRYSDKNCTLYRTFIFGYISNRLPEKKQFIPTECQKCYKVVVRPETYKELLQLKEIMEEMDFPSKCGTEKRAEVDALYGGYFYCNGLKEGRKRLEQVKFALLNTNMEAFLKRGCTEYEAKFGPSNKWKVTKFQRAVEQEVNDRIHMDNYKYPQRETDKRQIMSDWKEFSEKIGDGYKGSHSYVTY